MGKKNCKVRLAAGGAKAAFCARIHLGCEWKVTVWQVSRSLSGFAVDWVLSEGNIGLFDGGVALC